jgi:methionine synthase I (cobalamin-dependent)
MTDRLAASLARGPLVLDAAMGTRLIARGLNLGTGDPCLWNLDHPGEVAAIHARDVAAGADAILTNTFGANRAWLARFSLSGRVVAINRRAVALARDAAGPDRFVLGSIGPTASEDPVACREQAEALIDAGADALVFETHRDAQAEAALSAVRPIATVPLLVSLVAWPDAVSVVARRLADLGASALGGNCQPGMGPALRLAEALRRAIDLPIIVKPAASGPGLSIPAHPASFAAAVPRLLELGPILVGGCCGATEAHVAALRDACYAGTGRSMQPEPEAGRTP